MICAQLVEQRAAERFMPTVVSLIHEAGNPYLDWFFGGSERARLALESWVRRPSSEYAIERIRGAFDEDVLAGIYVGIGGADLAVCRKADAVAAFKAAGSDGRAALSERLIQRRGLFPQVTDDEFYLSNVGVAASHRGTGLGRRLLDAYLSDGRAAGYSRFRLDVNAENIPAQRLYESSGFREVHNHSTPDGQLHYRSFVLERKSGQ